MRYVVQYTLQAAVLLIFSNYYAYIILLPLMVIPNNVAVYLAARKHYPDIVCQGELDPVTKKDIYKRVGTLFGHKPGQHLSGEHRQHHHLLLSGPDGAVAV